MNAPFFNLSAPLQGLNQQMPKLLLACSISALLSTPAMAADSDVLKAFADSTADEEGISKLTWESGHYCDWDGVLCDTDHRVTHLQLANLGLQGTLPDTLGDLSELQVLLLSGNNISGELPASMASLSKLQKLEIDDNAFAGLPDVLVGMNQLLQLNINFNRFLDFEDEEISASLDARHLGGQDWSATQTVAPLNLQASERTIDSITLEWSPIEYTSGGGAYQIFKSIDAQISESELVDQTDSKSNSTITVSGLNASQRYYFAVRSVTDKSGTSDHGLISELSETVSEFTLRDSDGDNIPDILDDDADNDGLTAEQETRTKDTDGDGLPDHVEHNFADTDADGNFDYADADDDNDGRTTLSELGERPDNPQDSDADGNPDYLDVDSDNAANTADGSGDSDGDGFSDLTECATAPNCVDTDGDGIANYMDKDDDGDGLLTVEEGVSSDSDGDGLIDALEPNNLDADADGLRNHEDDDDDGDGVLTSQELNGQLLNSLDADGDNIPDYLDRDSNNSAATSDGSGDSDGDGVSDAEECPAAPKCVDANNNSVPSYLDDSEIVSRKLEVVDDPDTTNVQGETAAKVSSGGGGATHPLWIFSGLMLAALRKRIFQ